MQTVFDDSYWAYYQQFKAQCAEQGHIDQHCDKIFKENPARDNQYLWHTELSFLYGSSTSKITTTSHTN